MSTIAPQRAICLNHPRREAAARCTSCGQSYCRECVTSHEGRMVCSTCYRSKTEIKEKAPRDWFVLFAALQTTVGFAVLWFTVWLIGRLLISIPARFHEGTVWEKFGN
jgi:hypothetical protein